MNEMQYGSTDARAFYAGASLHGDQHPDADNDHHDLRIPLSTLSAESSCDNSNPSGRRTVV